jgi:hypothetical protein
MKPDRIQTDSGDPTLCPMSHIFSRISEPDTDHSDIDIYLIYVSKKSNFEYSDSDTVGIKCLDSDIAYPYWVLTLSGRMDIGKYPVVIYKL